jgi:hypothetical protein
MIYDKICSLPECEQCGKYSGFDLLNPRKFLTISSQKKNESHDLRLLNSIYQEMAFPKEGRTKTLNQLNQLFERVKYGKGIAGSNKSYGTLEQSKLNLDGSVIENVTDAYFQLMFLITSSSTMLENGIYSNDDIDGTLHVYDDRPMVYVRE